MNEFEKLILNNLNDIKNDLNEVKNKINNLDTKMNILDTKVNTVITQTAKNTEFNTMAKTTHEQLENEIAEIKKRLEV